MMESSRLVTFATVCLVIFPFVFSQNITEIRRLKNALTVESNYDKFIRPVLNHSQTIDVQISFAVTSIVSFDLVNARVVVTGYLYVSWTDEQLRWNPLEFDGISKLMLQKDSIWVPDLKNAFDLANDFAVSRTHVYYNGRVTWVPVNIFNSICQVDITYYPYDEHMCHFPFFSPSEDLSTISLIPLLNGVGMNNFNKHGEWDVASTSSEVMVTLKPHSQELASSYVCTLVLRRRPRFALLHTYFPLLLLYFVNILTFRVPLDKGERVSFAITFLLALVFFTSSISATFPHSSLDTSYFSMTMIVAICASTLGVMLSVILVKLDAETTRPIPAVLRRLAARNKRKNTEHLFWRKRDLVFAIEEEEDKLKESPGKKNNKTLKQDRKSSVTLKSENVEEEAVTWPDVARALDNIALLIYAVLVVVSVVVLLILHHNQQKR